MSGDESVEKLREKIQMLEEKSELEAESFIEEKKDMQKQIDELQESLDKNTIMEQRLQKLEQSFSGMGQGSLLNVSRANESNSMQSPVAAEITTFGGKEMSLNMTFGDAGTKPSDLERFLTHYNLVDEINTERGVRTWSKASYRALVLRLALRGSASDYINQETKMLSLWVKDDKQIIIKLKEKYIKNCAIELHILSFETSSQLDGEPLGEYMVRLQGLVENAYGTHPPNVKQLKVVWQFLNGIRDKDVRETLIKERWMLDGVNAKPYEEILKIAENAVNIRKAAGATGKSNGGKGIVGAVPRRDGQSKSLTKPSRSRENTSRNYRNQGGSSQTSSDQGNWKCHYCQTTDHSGGWWRCQKRLDENPKWRPGDKGPGF